MSLLEAAAQGYHYCEHCERIPPHVASREVAGTEVIQCGRCGRDGVKWLPPVLSLDLTAACDCCHKFFPFRELTCTGPQFLCARCL